LIAPLENRGHDGQVRVHFATRRHDVCALGWQGNGPPDAFGTKAPVRSQLTASLYHPYLEAALRRSLDIQASATVAVAPR